MSPADFCLPIPISPHAVDTIDTGMLIASCVATSTRDGSKTLHLTIRAQDMHTFETTDPGITVHLCDEHARSLRDTINDWLPDLETP